MTDAQPKITRPYFLDQASNLKCLQSSDNKCMKFLGVSILSKEFKFKCQKCSAKPITWVASITLLSEPVISAVEIGELEVISDEENCSGCCWYWCSLPRSHWFTLEVIWDSCPQLKLMVSCISLPDNTPWARKCAWPHKGLVRSVRALPSPKQPSSWIHLREWRTGVAGYTSLLPCPFMGHCQQDWASVSHSSTWFIKATSLAVLRGVWSTDPEVEICP